MRVTTLLSCVLLALTSTAFGAAEFKITETYVGVSGPDGTPDWIEVTNFGDMDGDTGVLYYDDENPTAAGGVQLPSFTLSPLESAVFIVTGDAADTSIADFIAVWGSVPNLGYATGGGGLSQNGDVANILLVDDTVVDSLAFGASDGVNTWEDPTGMGPVVLSAVGVNGAYESNPFVNENIGFPPGPGATISLVGSPGRIPEPTAVALLLAAAGLFAARQRG